MKVRYVSAALRDMDEILTYISERDPAAAARLLEQFLQAGKRLASMPFLGAVAKDEIRAVVVGSYLMFYEVKGNEVIILYIRHGARLRPWENS